MSGWDGVWQLLAGIGGVAVIGLLTTAAGMKLMHWSDDWYERRRRAGPERTKTDG